MKIHVIIDGAYQWNYWHDKSTRCWWCAKYNSIGNQVGYAQHAYTKPEIIAIINAERAGL